jgi:hypothetical protein
MALFLQKTISIWISFEHVGTHLSCAFNWRLSRSPSSRNQVSGVRARLKAFTNDFKPAFRSDTLYRTESISFRAVNHITHPNLLRALRQNLDIAVAHIKFQ